MADFFNRLKNYYLDVANVLRGQAKPSTIFPNTTDSGFSREAFYAEFLKQHLPSKCNIFYGGFLFDENGNESKQLDIIITTDTTPRYNFSNTKKSFSPIEGTLGVVSVKTKLDKKELFDSLNNFASIPTMTSLEGRVPFTIKMLNGHIKLFMQVIV